MLFKIGAGFAMILRLFIGFGVDSTGVFASMGTASIVVGQIALYQFGVVIAFAGVMKPLFGGIIKSGTTLAI